MNVHDSQRDSVLRPDVSFTSFPTLSPSGDLPAEDPDHSSVLSVHAGPQAGRLSVALVADSYGWSGSRAGTASVCHL